MPETLFNFEDMSTNFKMWLWVKSITEINFLIILKWHICCNKGSVSIKTASALGMSGTLYKLFLCG